MRITVKALTLSLTLCLAVTLVASGCGRLFGKKPVQPIPGSPAAPAGISIIPSYIHMVDETRGWAIFGTSVYRTSDGGKTWMDVTFKTAASSPGASVAKPPIEAEAFIDANAAYCAVLGEGGLSFTVFKTADGGSNWDSQTVKVKDRLTAVKSMTFLDTKTGWLLASYGAGAGSEWVDLFGTADGGISWTALSTQGSTGQQEDGFPRSGTKSGVSFADKDTGWITGLWPADTIYLFRTVDGGKTWKQQSLTVPAGYHTEGGSAETRPPVFYGASSENGFLPILFHQEGQAAIFYATNDKGATWTATTPVKPSANAQLTWSFPDASHGFVTDGIKVFVTEDGCRTWTVVTPATELARVSQVDFVSATVGWALGENLFLKTVDGGKTWSAP